MCRCLPLWVLLLAGGVAWPDDAEDKAAELVEKLGGTVTRDETKEGKPVVGVGLNGTKVTDAELKDLASLKSLLWLDLAGTQVGDVGVKDLAALKNLTRLGLYKTKVTDALVKELQDALPKCNISH